jgi:lysophospholipase L1-like esterase
MDDCAAATKIVFVGDSITACHRNPIFPHGFGYVNEIRLRLPSNWKTVNRGVNGNRLIDLERRWDKDVIDHSANFVSIAIGINDTWRKFDRNDASSDLEFSERYARLISKTSKISGTNIFLCEPFIIPLNAQMQEWREDLNGKLSAIRALAAEFKLVLVPFDLEMNHLAKQYDSALLTKDGIHPTKFGHSKMADFWLSACKRGL